MFLTSDFQKLQKIYRTVAVALLIVYPVSYFLIDRGSIVAFTVIYLLCFIFPTWYTWKLVNKWRDSEPLIRESAILREVNLSISELQNKVKQLAQRRRWRVKRQNVEEKTYSITIETPISLYSFGETICITATVAEGCVERVALESTSKIPTTEADDGKNSANIEAVRTFLEATFQYAEKK